MSNPAFGSNPVFADPVKRRGEASVSPATLDAMYGAPSATPVDTAPAAPVNSTINSSSN